MGTVIKNNLRFWELDFKWKLFLLSLLSASSLIFLMQIGNEFLILFSVLSLITSLVFIFNFKITFVFLLILLFTPFHFFSLHLIVYFTFILFSSLLITHEKIVLSEFRNTYLSAILIYVIFSIPSFFNTIDPIMSLFKANNLIAIILVMTSIPIVLKRRTDLYFILYIYLFLTAIDSIYVIVNGIITGGRVFGFSGVFYVDLSGIGALVSIILFIYERNMKKIIFGLLMILITTGLIFTQTRNAWLSTGLSLFIILLLLLIKSVKFYVKKSKIIKILTVIIVTIIGIYFISSQVSAGLEDRISSEESSQVITDDPGSISSSYVSRLLIWHTAYNAFAKHPFIGIGFYSFSFSSHLYYTIPKSFYKTFVMERTPHVTWIAVLTETGIVGLIGFIFLVFTIIKIGIKELSLVSNPDEAKITVVIIGIHIYILISMFMTDAWLWGQQVVLWGITLGMSVSNYNLLLGKMKYSE